MTTLLRHKVSLGFTVLELLITAAIIGVMAIIALPNFEEYNQKSEFQDKVSELKTMISQVNVYAQNPEKGKTSYSFYVSYPNFLNAWKVELRDNSNKVLSQSVFPSYQSFDGAITLNCFVAGSDCTVDYVSSSVILGSTPAPLMILTDNSFKTPKKVQFNVANNPFRVTTEDL